jgi:hypothetical protein
MADAYDIIHNHFDYLPLTYSGLTTTPLVTTIHGFSSPGILPVYKKYNKTAFYVSISDADRSPELDYIETIHHGVDIRSLISSRCRTTPCFFSGASTTTRAPAKRLKSPGPVAKS